MFEFLTTIEGQEQIISFSNSQKYSFRRCLFNEIKFLRRFEPN